MKRLNFKEYKLDGGSAVKLFESTPDKDLNMAVVEQSGRYPESGFNINHVSTEGLYVIEGEITLHLNNESIALKTGEAFYILPKTKYWLDGTAKVFVAVNPSSENNKSEILNS